MDIHGILRFSNLLFDTINYIGNHAIFFTIVVKYDTIYYMGM